MNLPEYAALALEILEEAGYEAYVVGGCVRDSLLGRTPGDFDVCTSALPNQTRDCFDGSYRVIETGLKHGTVTVLIQGKPLEITTFRTEGKYTDLRRPDSVSFVDRLPLDLARRDFTVNAMAYNKRTGIIDLFGGQEDLGRRLIRCVGEPEKRFGEDALRILRALRFSSVLDFEIEEHTAAAARELRENLTHIAPERIYIEMKKLLCGPGAGRIAGSYQDVLFSATGSLAYPGRMAEAKDLAVAFCLCFADADRVLTYLRAPKAVIASAKALQGSKNPTTMAQALERMGAIGREDFARLIEYFRLCGADVSLLQGAADSGLPCKIAELAVTGEDLKDAGIPGGPAMGRALNALLRLVMEQKVENRREALLSAKVLGDIRAGL